MFTIEVIPLARSTTLESLTYFSSISYEIGTLVKIPVRGRQLSGVVIGCTNVSNTKTALKAATFSLRKLPIQKEIKNLPKTLVETMKAVSLSTAVSIGSVVFSLLPTEIREGETPYPESGVPLSDEESVPQVLTATLEDRIIHYRSLIRGAFAGRGSVLLVVPSAPTATRLVKELNTGIEDRVVFFTGRQGKRERAKAYKDFADQSKTKLIITTPSHAYLDRVDITTIIVEEAASSHYRQQTRPYLDHVELLKLWAKETKRQIILGDVLPRTEDEYKRREDIYHTVGEFPKRINNGCAIRIIKAKDKPNGETPFALFAPEVTKRIASTLEGRHNVFIHAAHRGLAPVVACIDCATVMRCPDSGTPYSLLRTYDTFGNEKRWFVSGTSGKRVPAFDVCSNCGSWRLRERGIGIQYIVGELKELFPEKELIVFDHTTASSHKKAKDLAKRIADEKGVLVVGTNMVVSYLQSEFHLSIVSSVDAARSLPTWRADEQFFRLMLQIAELTSQEMLIQTRRETDDLLTYVTRGAIERFYEDELTLRDQLKYPPFSTFILLTWQGSSEAVAKIEAMLKVVLQDFSSQSQIYTNPHSQDVNKKTRHCLLRVSGDIDGLSAILRQLPPMISVKVNPDRIV